MILVEAKSVASHWLLVFEHGGARVQKRVRFSGLPQENFLTFCRVCKEAAHDLGVKRPIQ